MEEAIQLASTFSHTHIRFGIIRERKSRTLFVRGERGNASSAITMRECVRVR